MTESDGRLEALLYAYQEGANDVRTKADQYAKLWVSMFSVVGVLYAVSLRLNEGDRLFIGTPLLMGVWFHFICYTHATLSLLLRHMKCIEQQIEAEVGNIPYDTSLSWYRDLRELIHPAGRGFQWRQLIDWMLLPLFLVTFGVYAISAWFGLHTLAGLRVQAGDMGMGALYVVYFGLLVFLPLWPLVFMVWFKEKYVRNR